MLRGRKTQFVCGSDVHVADCRVARVTVAIALLRRGNTLLYFRSARMVGVVQSKNPLLVR